MWEYTSDITLREFVRRQLERMIDAMAGNGSPACTGEEALMSLATVLAAYESAEKDSWIAIRAL